MYNLNQISIERAVSKTKGDSSSYERSSPITVLKVSVGCEGEGNRVIRR